MNSTRKASITEFKSSLICSKKKSTVTWVTSLFYLGGPFFVSFFLEGRSLFSYAMSSLTFFLRKLFYRLICLISSFKSSSGSYWSLSDDESFFDLGVKCGDVEIFLVFLGLFLTIYSWFSRILELVLINLISICYQNIYIITMPIITPYNNHRSSNPPPNPS